MNILPLILALVLMLSVLTIEKMEKFKNQTVVQKQYQIFLKEGERQVFNQRQKSLYGLSQKTLRQLSFRFVLEKKERDNNLNVAKQYRLLLIDLMRIVYGEAVFFKNLEKSRPNFLEELFKAIEDAAEKAPVDTIKRIQDIARLDLEDPELQQAFYHMLKGTVTRKQLKAMKDSSPRMKEKAYVSLFNFINYDGKKATPRIIIQRAPREILKTLFMKDEIVEAILKRRNELAASKDAGAKVTFENEFKDKCRTDIEDQLLDFSISSSDKTEYN